MSSPFEVEATNSGGSSETPPEGNHPAVLVALIDLGTHPEEYQSKKYDARKVLLGWELVNETKGDGTPFVVSESYSLLEKLSTKAGLRKLLESWRGKPMADGERLDLAILLGKACLLNIGHSKSARGNTYGKILGISPPIKGMTIAKPFHQPFAWYIGSGPCHIPEWIPWLYGKSVEDIIDESRECGGDRVPAGAGVGANGSATAGASVASDDDIPF